MSSTPSTATESPANTYVPEYMPEGSVIIYIPGGVNDPVASVPQCLEFRSAGGLIEALDALEYSDVAAFASEPFHGGTTDFSRRVPWLEITVQGRPAFVVNAGKIASYWNHGVKPFVGSSCEAGLRAGIAHRADEAAVGHPDIG